MRRRILAGAGTLAGGQAASQICGFARNVIIARLISKDDFGIASTFLIAVVLLQMISHLAVDRMLVRAEDGDDPELQDVAHMLQAVRGVLIAAAMFALAWPIALMFGIPEVTWAFRCVAIIPLLRGFAHLDVKRIHRHMRFGRDAATTIIAQVITLAVAYPITVWFGDYSAVLWLLIMQTGIVTLMSHVVAERPYRWAWNYTKFVRFFHFGWPLLINGLLMFGTFQGDRLVVGTGYSMGALGTYAVAFTLTMSLAMLFNKVAGTLFLPVLSSAQQDEREFNYRYGLSFDVLLLIACGFAALFVVAGQPLVVLIYGEKYADAGILVCWLGVMQSIRLLRTAHSTAGIAVGDTKVVMYSNIIRSLALGAMVVLAVYQVELKWIAACGVGGEIGAYLYAMVKLRSRWRIPFAASLRAAGLLGATIAISVGGLMVVGTALLPATFAAATIGIAMTAVAFATSGALRSELRRALVRRREPIVVFADEAGSHG